MRRIIETYENAFDHVAVDHSHAQRLMLGIFPGSTNQKIVC